MFTLLLRSLPFSPSSPGGECRLGSTWDPHHAGVLLADRLASVASAGEPLPRGGEGARVGATDKSRSPTARG